MMTWVFSDHGTPANYRELDGFSVHAFKWVNSEGKVTYIKYKWESAQGVNTLNADEVVEVRARTSITPPVIFMSTSQTGIFRNGACRCS